jgi:chromosome segregation ATPase
MEKKAAELEPVAEQCEALNQEIVGLTGHRDELEAETSGLQDKLELLKSRVKELEQRERDLLRRNKDMEAEAERAESALGVLRREKRALAKAGLSLEEMADVSHMAQTIARHHGVTSADLVKKLLQWLKNLDKATGLEIEIKVQQKELKEQQQAAALAQQELEGLKAAIAAGKKEKIQLDAGLERIRGEIDIAINGIVPSAREAFDQCRKELQRVRDEAIKAGKEVGRLEHIVECNQWILDLLSMIQRDRVVEPGKVKSIMLLVMLSFSAWLKIQEKTLVVYSLDFAVSNLIKELEQWKT